MQIQKTTQETMQDNRQVIALVRSLWYTDGESEVRKRWNNMYRRSPLQIQC